MVNVKSDIGKGKHRSHILLLLSLLESNKSAAAIVLSNNGLQGEEDIQIDNFRQFSVHCISMSL